MSFDDDLVEANAFYTQTLNAGADEAVRSKLKLIEQIWDLHTYELGRYLARVTGAERAPDTRAPLLV